MSKTKTHENYTQIAEAVFKQSLQAAQELAREQMAELDKRLAGMESQVLEIKMPDKAAKKLKSPAHPKLELLLKLVMIGNQTNAKWPYLVGPAGSGKTSVAAQVADALDQRFGTVSLTAGASETWLWGRQTPKGFSVGQFADFYENGGVFLFDELDSADANLLIALNTALANGSAYNPIEGRQIKRHKDFYCIAAGNTFGLGADFAYTGRERLDAATLDRFAAIVFDYEPCIEKSLCQDKELRELLQSMRSYLRDQKSSYANTITYRAFSACSAYHAAGISAQQVLDILAASWPQDLKKQVFKQVGI